MQESGTDTEESDLCPFRARLGEHQGFEEPVTGSGKRAGEIRFAWIPAAAREPKPADGAVDVEPNAMLSWRVGRDAVSYDVYLGTDPNTLERVGTTTETRLAPSGLEYGTDYAWMVVAVNGDEAWDSDVWSFSTLDYAVVDDMEGYTDDLALVHAAVRGRPAWRSLARV